MKKNRIVAGLLAAVVSLSVLGGCGKTSEAPVKESEESTQSTDNGGEIALRMAWWGNDSRHQATLDAIKSYTDANPGVSVKSEYNGFASYQEKVTTQLAGNTEPTIMQVNYDWFPIFSRTGVGFYDIYQLKDYIDLSQYDEEFLKLGEIEGKLNGIPLGKNTLTLIVNKSVYDELGVQIPKTWDDFVAAAEKFPEGSYPLVVEPRLIIYIYLQQKTGKSLLTQDNQLNYSEVDYVDGLKWYKDMVDKGVFGTREDYLENVGSTYSSLAQNQKFIDGQYAGTMEWSGALDAYKQTLESEGQELAIVPMPQIEGSKVSGTISKPNMFFTISKNAEKPEEAAKLINHLLNDPEGVKLMALSRGIPASKVAAKTLEEAGMAVGIVKEATDLGEQIVSLPQMPNYDNTIITETFRQYDEAFELGQMSLEDAAKAIYTEITDALSTLN
ncbi:MAG: yesO [Clostridia bacterium]|nr:yesO [Clostridia bacterium]